MAIDNIETAIKIAKVNLSTTDFYDSKTHEMLGKYLRLYRD